MSSERQSPSSSSPRGGDIEMTTPEPSASPRSGGRNNGHPQMNNGNEHTRKHIDLDPFKARIFYVQSTPISQLATLNGFIVKKALTHAVGATHECHRLRSGTLRVQVHTLEQVKDLHNMHQINGIPVTVEVPFASNTCKGVVSHYDFERMTEDNIVQEMKELDVVACRKFYKKDKHTKEHRPTNTVCLTFARTQLPESIYVGYELRTVYPFVPRPQRCNKCQRYGHSQFACRSQQPVCMRCAGQGHEISTCQAGETKCASCGGPHLASDWDCPVWKQEKDILEVKTLQRLSYKEARAKVRAVTQATPVPGVSYSSVAASGTNASLAKAPKMSNIGTSTNPLHELGDHDAPRFLTPTKNPTLKTKPGFDLGDDKYTEQENTQETIDLYNLIQMTTPIHTLHEHTQTSVTTNTTELPTQTPTPTPVTQELPTPAQELNNKHHRGPIHSKLVNKSRNDKPKPQRTQSLTRRRVPEPNTDTNQCYKVHRPKDSIPDITTDTPEIHNKFNILHGHEDMDTNINNKHKRQSSPNSDEDRAQPKKSVRKGNKGENTKANS